VLPAIASAEQALLNVAKDVIQVHGTAQVLELVCRSEAQTKQIMSLFDRSHDYAALVKTIHLTRKKTGTLSSAVLRRTLHQLSHRFTVLRSIDFFPGAAGEQVEVALTDLEATLQSRVSPGEPLATRRAIPQLDKKQYQHQTWVTRKRPWVDRLASAWLICRFIDPHARFVWHDHPQSSQVNGIGFDFDGATFTHIGHRVTFEVLLAAFALEGDPALTRIGNLVHLLDVGGIPVMEAKGVEAVLRGLKEQFSDDDRFLAHACAIFDSLHTAYRTEETEP